MKKWEGIAENLRLRMRGATWPPNGLLPPVRELAKAYDVSSPTILAAIAHLRVSGIIESGTQRERCYVSGYRKLTGRTEPVARGLRNERIAQQLKTDIIRGEFADGILPAAKELRIRYRCSHVTLRKAIQVVLTDGILNENHGKLAIVSRAEENRAGSRVYLTGGSRLLRGYEDHAFLFVLSLERQIQRMGWGQLSFFLTDSPESDMSQPPDHLVGGIIHVIQGAAKEWSAFLKQRPNQPLILVDLQESMRWKLRNKILFRVMPDNHRAGIEAARHLYDNGHRNIALFSHSAADQAWACKRMAGIREIFENAPNSKITVFQLATSESHATEELLLLRKQVSGFRSALTHTGKMKSLALRDDCNRVYSIIEKLQLSCDFEDLFAQALADSSITAWICINDAVAVAANSFLEICGKRVPNDIAVSGFDNSPISYQLGITSYDFLMDRMAHEALRCLQNPALMTRDGTCRHLPGQLIIRNSSAPMTLTPA